MRNLLTSLENVTYCTSLCIFLERSAKLPKTVCPFDVARHANDCLLTQVMQSSVPDSNNAVCWWGIHVYRLIARLSDRSYSPISRWLRRLFLALRGSHVRIPVRRLGILTDALQDLRKFFQVHAGTVCKLSHDHCPLPPFFCPWHDSP
jgi:hypothetical protein